jgi:hypothetical protein
MAEILCEPKISAIKPLKCLFEKKEQNYENFTLLAEKEWEKIHFKANDLFIGILLNESNKASLPIVPWTHKAGHTTQYTMF